ncbi:hypothetical protein LL06_17030 [Hoeflea sp. BAL378]|nr:hypothetical protein LL06_17030 [Hoeflea sp. BAL378]
MRPGGKHAMWFLLFLGLSLGTGPAPAEDTDGAALAAARALVLAALPGQCEEAPDSGDNEAYVDRAMPVSWKPSWAESDDAEERAMLYQIFCFAGAYSTIYAYVLKPENDTLSLLSFAEPSFTVDRVEDDDTFTQLKGPPKVTGYVTVPTLFDPEFDAATLTLSSFGRWRGMADAWSKGTWQLRDGRFVLTSFEIDPIYELNLNDPTDALSEISFKLYP